MDESIQKLKARFRAEILHQEALYDSRIEGIFDNFQEHYKDLTGKYFDGEIKDL